LGGHACETRFSHGKAQKPEPRRGLSRAKDPSRDTLKATLHTEQGSTHTEEKIEHTVVIISLCSVTTNMKALDHTITLAAAHTKTSYTSRTRLSSGSRGGGGILLRVLLQNDERLRDLGVERLWILGEQNELLVVDLEKHPGDLARELGLGAAERSVKLFETRVAQTTHGAIFM
jgi:hypothetical protein